jgi:hypothetical protein
LGNHSGKQFISYIATQKVVYSADTFNYISWTCKIYVTEIRTVFSWGQEWAEREGIFWSDGNILYLMGVGVTQVYTFIKCVCFVGYKLYFSKINKKTKRKD